jgi:hypothetical protein
MVQYSLRQFINGPHLMIQRDANDDHTPIEEKNIWRYPDGFRRAKTVNNFDGYIKLLWNNIAVLVDPNRGSQ